MVCFSCPFPVEPSKLVPFGMKTLLMAYYSNTILNVLFGWILDFMFSIMRLFRASPRRFSCEAWSFQQCGFLMQNIVLLAKSKGIGRVARTVSCRLSDHGGLQ